MKPFTNIHSHVFTAKHSPEYFLKTALPDWMPSWLSNALARRLNDLLQKKDTRQALSFVSKCLGFLSPKFRSVVQRTIEFIEIGTSSTQKEIFDDISKTYTHLGGFRIVVLTQVLDYLDLEQESNHIRIQTQVAQIAELKRHALYQQNIYPFLGVDPRMTGMNLLDDWVNKYINKDYGFCGIKIYPAAGYFPFDPCLDPIWEWAEKKGIPVMTHCTRGGSWYLGSFDSILGTGAFDRFGLNPNDRVEGSILARINALKKDKKMHRKNHIWCNIFGHPENYKVVLKKYPKLKICLAHFGGANEVLRSRKTDLCATYPPYFDQNWYTEVFQMMKEYENVYSDISYTLSNKKALKIIKEDLEAYDASLNEDTEISLWNKLMYGTDFYLTQQEKKGDEPDLQTLFFSTFTRKQIVSMAYNAPAKFLK